MKWRDTIESLPRAAAGALRVEVRGGYLPDTIVTRAGEPLRLTFNRHESWPCSDRVIFPDFGLTAALPAQEDVVVDLLPAEPGDYEFTCGKGRLRGRLIVEPAAGRAPGA